MFVLTQQTACLYHAYKKSRYGYKNVPMCAVASWPEPCTFPTEGGKGGVEMSNFDIHGYSSFSQSVKFVMIFKENLRAKTLFDVNLNFDRDIQI